METKINIGSDKTSVLEQKILKRRAELGKQALINRTCQILTQENCKGLGWSRTRCIVPDSSKETSSFRRRFSQQSMRRPCLCLTSSCVHSVGVCSGPSFHSSTENFRVAGANDTVVLLSFPVVEMSMEKRFHWNVFCVALLLSCDMCHSKYEHENHKNSWRQKMVF